MQHIVACTLDQRRRNLRLGGGRVPNPDSLLMWVGKHDIDAKYNLQPIHLVDEVKCMLLTLET